MRENEQKEQNRKWRWKSARIEVKRGRDERQWRRMNRNNRNDGA
jgi:hypothetical protein